MSRKPTPPVMCKICGKHYAARGIKTHLRLFHHIKITEKITEIVEKTHILIKKKSHNSSNNLSKLGAGGVISQTTSSEIQKLIFDADQEIIQAREERLKRESDPAWKPQTNPFRVWYIRDEKGHYINRAFATEEEALQAIEKRKKKG